MAKAPQSPKKMSDSELKKDILSLRDAWNFYDTDPDAFRLGRDHYMRVQDKLSDSVQEMFNRVTKEGLNKHRSFETMHERLSGLRPAERRNAEKVEQALRGIETPKR